MCVGILAALLQGTIKVEERRGGTPADGRQRGLRPALNTATCSTTPALGEAALSAGLHEPPSSLNLPEGFPGCVIPRWLRLRGQPPGQSARHRYPTPLLAFLTPET